MPQTESAEEASRDAKQHVLYCPTMNRDVEVGLHPAGEVCQGCKRLKGKGAHECDFIIT